jgi:hypothetical protein
VTFDPGQRPDGWAALSIRATATGRVFPGWWRRDGQFVLTMAFDDAVPPPADPPRMLAQTADLSSATPVHTWLTNPLAW